VTVCMSHRSEAAHRVLAKQRGQCLAEVKASFRKARVPARRALQAVQERLFVNTKSGKQAGDQRLRYRNRRCTALAMSMERAFGLVD
jgi:hypothetical protein